MDLCWLLLFLGVDDECLIQQVKEYFSERVKHNGINKVRINLNLIKSSNL
jgi:hypothetical protein